MNKTILALPLLLLVVSVPMAHANIMELAAKQQENPYKRQCVTHDELIALTIDSDKGVNLGDITICEKPKLIEPHKKLVSKTYTAYGTASIYVDSEGTISTYYNGELFSSEYKYCKWCYAALP